MYADRDNQNHVTRRKPTAPTIARRVASDRRSKILALATLGAALLIFAAAKLWFPLLDTAFEWLFGALAVFLILAEGAMIVHNVRRRRRWHPPVPKPAVALTPVERIAAQVISEIVFEYPLEVALGRAKGDMNSRMKRHIDSAWAQFSFIVGETPESLHAFRSQLGRILAGGESRLVHFQPC